MSSQNLTVVDKEDLECIVCCHDFCRRGRVPLVLNCKHTFCVHCLQRISKRTDAIRTICCPLCRWKTCVVAGQLLVKALDVDYEVWKRIPEKQPQETHSKVSDPRYDFMSTVRTRRPHEGQTVFQSFCHRPFLRRIVCSH